MTSAPKALCDTCGGPLLSAQLAGGHCSRCLFKITFSDEEPAPEDEDSAPWTRLAGCELYEEIGRGGMGVVYRARQRALDRIVAVKVLLRSQFVTTEERQRFHREAQAAARLQHPGIVGIFDVGEESDVPWFSMEYIAGQNLERRVREHPMEACEAARCAQQVALALQHAHEHGVLHRDLKPSNILLDPEGAPRITDFGIARIATTDTANNTAAGLTQTGQILGSPGYSAPEQALHGHADFRTDVYGLGALLYHLLTGRPPFQGPTLDAILMQLRESEPLSPRRLNPTVPPDLETICLKCLHKQALGRYSSAAEVAADLGRFLEGLPILARPLSPVAKAYRWACRYPALATLTLVIGLLLLAILLGAGLFIRHQAQREHRTVLISEARSLRQQRLAGSRDEALRSLREAWEIAPAAEIRNEAIACLALPDFAPQQSLDATHPEAQAPNPGRSADGRRGLQWEGESLVITDLTTAREITRLTGYSSKSLAQLDDHGERVAIALPKSGTLKIISLQDGSVTATCQHPVALTSLDWSGDLLAMGCENRFIYIWNDHGQLKHRLSGHQAVPIQVRFRPRSQELCSTAGDIYVRLWHAARGVEIMRRETQHPPHTRLWWSPEGDVLYAGLEDGSAEAYRLLAPHCFDLLAPPQEEPHTENLGSASFSQDGHLAAVVDEECCRVWDFQTGRLVTTLSKAPAQWLSAQFSPDNQHLWVCGWDHELRSYPLQRDALGRPTLGSPGRALLGKGCLLRGISPEGDKLVLSNNGQGQFLIFWPQTRKTLRLKHPGTLAAVLSPLGHWIMTSSYTQTGARIWSVPEGKDIHTLCPKDTVMNGIASADGQYLLLQTSGGNRCYRTRDWTEQPPLSPKLRLNNVTPSPDGRWIATLGDTEIRLLDARTFQEQARLTLPAHFGWLGESHLLFSADSRHLLIHSALGSVGRWDIPRLEEELKKLGMPLPAKSGH